MRWLEQEVLAAAAIRGTAVAVARAEVPLVAAAPVGAVVAGTAAQLGLGSTPQAVETAGAAVGWVASSVP
ncbi:hypothetical protein GCM10008997_38820 [Halomonas salifodinae]